MRKDEKYFVFLWDNLRVLCGKNHILNHEGHKGLHEGHKVNSY
jgi:hypothetical protein